MMHAMEVRAEINYPNTSTEQAFALGMDPAFRAAVCEATHATDFDVDISEHDDGSASVEINRTMPADLPDLAKKFMGDTVNVVQTEKWSASNESGARTADLTISIKGQPAKMVGGIFLESIGDDARMRIAGNIKVSIPFVGKTIEGEVAKGIVAAATKEQETGIAWLSRQR